MMKANPAPEIKPAEKKLLTKKFAAVD